MSSYVLKKLVLPYIQLSKPRVTFANLLAGVAGYFLAIGTTHFTFSNVIPLLWMSLSLTMIIASAESFNMIYEQDVDALMERTSHRVLLTGELSQKQAFLYASIMVFSGILILTLQVNLLSAWFAFIGFFTYVHLYTPMKRTTVYNTEVGSISGAMPPIVGYVAVTNHFDLTALALLLFLFFWQPVHVFALAVRRSEDYSRANLKILPSVYGFKRAKIMFVFYLIGTIFSSLSFYYLGRVGIFYLVISVILNTYYVFLAIQWFKMKTYEDDLAFSRTLFFYSIFYLMFHIALMMMDSL